MIFNDTYIYIFIFIFMEVSFNRDTAQSSKIRPFQYPAPPPGNWSRNPFFLFFYKNALKTHETPFAKLLPRMNVHHENDSLITMQGCELVNFLLVLSFFNSRQQKPKKREIVKVGFLNFWVPSTAKRRTLQHQQFHVITFVAPLHDIKLQKLIMATTHGNEDPRCIMFSRGSKLDCPLSPLRAENRHARTNLFTNDRSRPNSCVGCVRTMQ